MVVTVEAIDVVGAHTILEGPHWDSDRQSLYFNDVLDGKIFRYDYRGNKFYEATIDGKSDTKIGFIVPVHGKSDEFVVGAGNSLVVLKWDGMSSKATIKRSIVDVEKELGTTRFNDGKVDPRGRIFAGTMLSEGNGDIFTERIGAFYRFDHGQAPPKILRKNVNISNGLTWNEKTNKFYYVDTGDLTLLEYDYKPETGDISGEKVILEIPKDSYVLDGMTIDDHGFLYIATFKGGRVLKVDPKSRRIIDEIMIPGALQITSVAFGGPNMDELFVTTGAIQSQPGPNGRLFKVTGLGAKGVKMHSAKI